MEVHLSKKLIPAAEVILLSKYFSSAKENKNKEKTEIKTDGIKVNNEKKPMYFLLDLDPSVLMSFFNEFLTSINVATKKIKSKNKLKINKY